MQSLNNAVKTNVYDSSKGCSELYCIHDMDMTTNVFHFCIIVSVI